MLRKTFEIGIRNKIPVFFKANLEELRDRLWNTWLTGIYDEYETRNTRYSATITWQLSDLYVTFQRIEQIKL